MKTGWPVGMISSELASGLEGVLLTVASTLISTGGVAG